jgi:type I restriction enzyme, R subunit
MDLRSGLLTDRLGAAVSRINPQLSEPVSRGVALSVGHTPYPGTTENNRWFHSLLIDGVPVEYRDKALGETRGGVAYLLDFENIANNEFVVVSQLRVTGSGDRSIRADLVLYINGLPLVVIELKDPADTQATLGTAIDQLRGYTRVVPETNCAD